MNVFSLRAALFISVLCWNVLVFAKAQTQDVAKLLKTRKNWISGTFLRSPDQNLVPHILKKWRVQNKSLVEVTSNSVESLSDGSKRWVSESLDLSKKINYSMIASLTFKNPSLQILSAEAFVLKTPNAVTYFRSSNNNQDLLPPTIGNFAHMTAPVAFMASDLGLTSPFDPFPTTPHLKQTALRHDLSQNRPVYVHKKFPRGLLAAVESALKEWNRGLKTNYYKLVDTNSDYTEDLCFTQNILCIFWKGPETLAWANHSGSSAVFYDPAVGNILGGVITLTNYLKKDPQQKVPVQLLQALNDPKKSSLVAGTIWAQPKYKTYLNPDPIGTVTSVLVHELGHDQGFRHYFAGSLHASAESPSDTVMEYLPYPLFSKIQKLQPRDLAKINALYFHGKFGTLSSPEMPCADKDTATNPLCNPQDVGDPALFYSSILQALGPFAKIKISGGVSADLNRSQPIMNYVARYLMTTPFVTTFQQMHAKQTLCENQQVKAILLHLTELSTPLQLNCNGVR